MVTYGTTAMSLGFFLKTGGEVKWKSSLDFASDPKGMKVLMSEAQSTVPPAIALLIASWLARPVIFSACNTIVASFGAPLRKGNLILYKAIQLKLMNHSSSILLALLEQGIRPCHDRRFPRNPYIPRFRAVRTRFFFREQSYGV